jgi:hypothetical protein
VLKRRARAASAGWLGAGLAATLTLGACKGPDLISLGGESASGNVRYLSPMGDDLNPGTIDSPWKTFAYALPQLQPGWTLRLLDGTYDVGTSGMLNVRCADAGPQSTVPTATHASDGTPGTGGVITVRSDRERKAWLRGDGRVPPISIDSCHNWSILGFYATSQDADTQATNPATGSVVVLDGPNQGIELQDLLLAHANRYFAGAHLLRIGDGASDVNVEANELYDFHASAIEAWRSSSLVIARNYVNSRDTTDKMNVAAGITLDGARGDYGVRLQETASVYVLNNVVEDVNTAFAVVGRDVNVDAPVMPINLNWLLGNIAYHPASIGFAIDSQCADQNPCDAAHTVNGTTLENDVVYGGGMGIYDAGSVGTKVEQASIIDAARGVYLWKDMHNAAIGATAQVRDTVAVGYQSVAYAAGGNQTDWRFDHCAASGGYDPTQAYEPDNVPNVTNKVTVTPDLGDCIAYLPANSKLRMGGVTVGANVVYRYSAVGQPTTDLVWNPGFAGCGAQVTGVNDDSSPISKPSCSDVVKQLNINMGTCGLPL